MANSQNADILNDEELDALLAHYLGEELVTQATITLPDPDAELPITVVTSAAEARQAYLKLRDHAEIAVDCEAAGGMHRFGRLALVQVGTGDCRGEVFLFDVFAGGEAVLGPLRAVLEDARVTKVMHDCRGDADVLRHGHGVALCGVMDTQVLYAAAVAAHGRPPPLPVSLRTLHAKFGIGEFGRTKELARGEMGEDEGYWERRPMSALMLRYAAQDVRYLVFLYRQLMALLGPAAAAQGRAYSAEYVAQYSGRSEEERRRDVKAEEERDTSVRYVPRYNIEAWDAAAVGLELHGGAQKRAYRPDDDLPEPLRRKFPRRNFL